MKRSIVLICLIYCALAIMAQMPYDCVNAIPLCDSRSIELNVSGYGRAEINHSCGCEAWEHNSIWFKFTIDQPGTLGFTLIPASTDIEEDYDFWVFGPNPNCNNLGMSLRCSSTNPLAAGLTSNHTGMNATENDTHEGPDRNGNSFVRWITVQQGETYFLVLDRAVGSNAFSLHWTGTATLLSPFVNEGFDSIPDIYLCGDATGKAQFDFDAFRNNYMRGHGAAFTAVLYDSETQATLQQGAITGSRYVKDGETYTLRLDHNSVECFDIKKFTIHVNAVEDNTKHEHIEVCHGDSVKMTTTPGLFTAWSPFTWQSESYAFVPDTSVQVKVQKYIPCNNSITNGDFEVGNTGFSSQLTYVSSSPNCLNNSPTYTIATNTTSISNSYRATNDHTSGTGKMMIINSPANNGQNQTVVWTKQVSVQPNTSYAFEAWAKAIGGNDVVLQTKVNNIAVNFRALANGPWIEQPMQWFSGNNTTATLTITVAGSSPSGLFVLDDISFSPLVHQVDTFDIVVHPSTDTIIHAQVCRGESYSFNGHVYTSNTTVTHRGTTAFGCDSVVTLNLSFVDFLTRETDVDICRGETYTFRGHTFVDTETYIDTFSSPFSCDSIVKLNVVVHDAYEQNIEAEICHGETYTQHNFNENQSGQYTQRLLTQYGCDSIITLDLKVRAAVTARIDNDFCNQRKTLNISYSDPDNYANIYQLKCDNITENAGLASIAQSKINTAGAISIPLSENMLPGVYNIELVLGDSICSNTIPLQLELPYSKDILVQKWNDVIAVLNSNYNGGYTFSAYQWLFNGQPIQGETHSYIYLPNKLSANGEYSVLLTRQSDGVQMYSCPITYVPHNETGVWTTLMTTQHTIAKIQSAGHTILYIYNTIGTLIATHQLYDGTNELELNLLPGVYIFCIVAENGDVVTEKVVVE